MTKQELQKELVEDYVNCDTGEHEVFILEKNKYN